MMEGLEVKDLVKIYGGRKVVDGLSLQVKPGEIVGLLGPNGAGKTTAFYMVIGLIRPDSGNVFFKGQDITSLPIHARSRSGLGYLAQEPSVFRDLTVEENLLTVLEATNLSYQSIHNEMKDLLEEFGLTRFAKRKASTLSGGERRRLEISRSLASYPQCLMLDEPFANIDPLAIADLKSMIQHLKKKGIGILITDHNAREIVSVVDRGYLVADGKVLRAGTSEELLADAQAKARYFGEGFSV
jgi:lipopolysaccharide export system ATP-binding protein